MNYPQPKAAAGADLLPSYEEALLDAGKARVLFDASRGGNVRGITEDHRFALADVISRAARSAPTIKFVRVERDCPANVDRRKAGDVRGIIYDFDVMIDGERRAYLKRTYTSKGYTLDDADGRAIGAETWRKHLGFEVKKKDDFETTVRRFLDAGLIPTIARMAELRADEEAALNAKRAAAAERYRVWRIKDAGVELYNALKQALPILEAANGRCSQDTAFIQNVRAAIAQAEMTHPDDAEQIEYEARHR